MKPRLQPKRPGATSVRLRRPTSRAAKTARKRQSEVQDARQASILAPQASDAPEKLADWVELQAMFSPERQFSLEALARVINRSGTTDALEDPEDLFGEDEAPPRAHRHPGDESRVVAEAAFSEIETRVRACRGHRDDAYPFDVTSGLIKLRGEPGHSDYEFLLLLSHSQPTSGHNGTAVLFELLCGAAALGHLGGSRNNARAWRFGSPRQRPLAKLREAIDQFCSLLGEGAGCSHPEAASNTGDGQLDIVAFRDFPDGRAGKLVVFGQCAAGATSAEDKLSELDPHAFMKKWLKKELLVRPQRVFFVPWRPPSKDWEFKVIDSGLLFDRCRIAACVEDEEFAEYRDRVIAANQTMMRHLQGLA